jgi:hypothetical protein
MVFPAANDGSGSIAASAITDAMTGATAERFRREIGDIGALLT